MITANRRPRGTGVVESKAASAVASSNPSACTIPYLANRASYATLEPDRLAVCEAVARLPAPERPALTATTDLPAATALAVASSKRWGSRILSQKITMTPVSGSPAM